jgi:hypothetical protein
VPPTTAAPATTAPAPVVEAIVFTGVAYDVFTPGKVSQAEFDRTWAAVLETLNRYLELAVLTPLRSGGPAGDLAPLFTPLSVDRVLTGPDRKAFIDENLPPASDLRPEAVVAGLRGLAGTDGVMSVVTAGLDLRILGHVDGAPLRVVRTGEVVLMPEGGTWRIDAWDITVTRTLAEMTTTTQARS